MPLLVQVTPVSSEWGEHYTARLRLAFECLTDRRQPAGWAGAAVDAEV